MNCAIHNEIPATAYCRTCGKPMCANCAHNVKGVFYCEDCLAGSVSHTLPAAVPVAVVSSGPNPALAGILSGFFPGIGQVYAGEVMRGVMVDLIFAALIFAVSQVHGGMEPFFGIGISFWYIYQIIDAVRLARAKQIGAAAPDPFGIGSAKWQARWEQKGSGTPLGAMILIAIGSLLLLGNIFSFGHFVRLWPLILVAIGAVKASEAWKNAQCPCMRCRLSRMTGPAVLLTLGVLFLLHMFEAIGIGHTFPILLIVIGGIKFLQLAGSTDGHISDPPSATTDPHTQNSNADQVHHG